jgi:hypothetical protein
MLRARVPGERIVRVESCPRAFCAVGLRSLCVKTPPLLRFVDIIKNITVAPNHQMTPPPPRSASPHGKKESRMLARMLNNHIQSKAIGMALWRLAQSIGTVSWME